MATTGIPKKLGSDDFAKDDESNSIPGNLEDAIAHIEAILDDNLDLRPRTTQRRKQYLVGIVLSTENLTRRIKKTGRFLHIWAQSSTPNTSRPDDAAWFLQCAGFSNRIKTMQKIVYKFSDLRKTFMDGDVVLYNADVVFESSMQHLKENEGMYENIGVRVVVLKITEDNKDEPILELERYTIYKGPGNFRYWKHNSLVDSLVDIPNIDAETKPELLLSDLRKSLEVNYDVISTPLTLHELLSTGMRMPYNRKLNHLAKKNGQGKLFVDTMLSILAAAQHLVNSGKAKNMSEAVSMLVLVYLGAGQPNPNPHTHHLAAVLRFFPKLHVIMYDTNSMDFDLDEYLVYNGVEVWVKDEKGTRIYQGQVVGNLDNGYVRVKSTHSRQNIDNVDIRKVELKRVDKRYKMITHYGACELVKDLRKIKKIAVVVSDIRSGVEGPIKENDLVRKQIEAKCNGDKTSGDESTDREQIQKLRHHYRLLEEARAEMVYNDMIFQMQILDTLKESGWLAYSSLKVATDYQDLADDKKKVYLPKDMHILIQPFIPSTEMRAGQFHDIDASNSARTGNWDLQVLGTKSDDFLTIKATEYVFAAEAPRKAAYYVKTVLKDFSKPKPKHYNDDEVHANFTERDGKLFLDEDATKKPDHWNQLLSIRGVYYRPCFEQESLERLEKFSAKDVDNALMYMHSIDRTHTGCNNAPIWLMLRLFERYRASQKMLFKRHISTKNVPYYVGILRRHAVRHAIPHIEHDEIDRYLMSSEMNTDQLKFSSTNEEPMPYLEQSVVTYTKPESRPNKVLDTQETFLDIILNAVQMNKEQLAKAFGNIKANNNNLELLGRIWLHVYDQFRFYTHACYTDIKSQLTAPCLEHLPGSTDTLNWSQIEDRKALCVDWFCYWLHNVQRTSDFDSLTAQDVFANMKELLVQTDLRKGQLLELDLGRSMRKTLNMWPKSKPVFFVAISHGLQCLVDLCLHAWDQDGNGTWITRRLQKESEEHDIKTIMETPFRKAEYEYYPLPYAVYHTTVKDNADREETYIKMLDYMLKSCDFDVNIPNRIRREEETALDIALHHKNARVVLMLLSDARTKLEEEKWPVLRDMASNHDDLGRVLDKRGVPNGTEMGQVNTAHDDLGAVNNPTDNDFNTLISNRDIDGLKHALGTQHKVGITHLNRILAIALKDMDPILVGLAVTKGAHTNNVEDLDKLVFSKNLRDKLFILLYLACANFNRGEQQTFKFTSKIMDCIQSLSQRQDGKKGMKQENVKTILRDLTVEITGGHEALGMPLIDWALHAEDYFAVGQLMNMGLSVQALQQQDLILRLVLQNKCEELQSSVSKMDPEIQNKIATGHAYTEAVRVAIGNYKNNEVMRALNATALAIATYLHRKKFNIVQQILSKVSGDIKHIDAELAVPLHGTKVISSNIATLVRGVSSEIMKYSKNTQNTIRTIRSKLKNEHQLELELPDEPRRMDNDSSMIIPTLNAQDQK